MLSARKVYLLSGLIIFLCAASLVCSITLANRSSETEPDLPVAVSVQPAQKDSAPPKATATPAKQSATSAKKAASAAEKKSASNSSSPVQNSSSAPKPASPKPTATSTKKSATVASAKPDKPHSDEPQLPPVPPPEPKSPFDIPPAKNGATLIFVIDDAGLHAENVRKYTALPFPIAIAVLPHLAETKECAAEIRRAKKELMLHQPMQAHSYPNGKIPNPGPGAILPDMTTTQIASTIKQNLDELGADVRGFNNHEGSLVTENEIQMGAVLEVALERGLYFLDSRTTSHSAVPQAALERDMRYIARFAPFLDNKIDRTEMLSELYKGLEVANKNGYAVIIGHVDKSVNVLPPLLTEIYPYLVQKGYKFSVPSMLK